MDVLSAKYKEHREEVLHALDVSKELLSLLTREGLLDIADCVKYQGILDKRKRTQALMKTLTERRTDRAYGILIQCLLENGQEKAANLLTDIGEESSIIAQLKKQLDNQIEAMDSYVEKEEKRAGVETTTTITTTTKAKKKPCGHGNKATKADAATSDKEVVKGAQESMRKAADQLDRCKIVINKLHEDCRKVAETNGLLTSQTRECYLQLSRMIRPSHKHADEIQKSTQTTQDLFRLLVDDVHQLLTRKSKAQERENEGRTSAMRTLRQLRDWIVDRSGVISSIHSGLYPRGSSRLNPARHALVPHAQFIKTSKNTSVATPSSHEHTDNSHILGPPAILDAGQQMDLHSPFPQDGVPPRPFATSTPQPPGINGPYHADSETARSRSIEIYPISSVVEGVAMLESQLREYIHLEILLTDRFRFEMRMKQHKKKAQGFTSQGLNEAQSILGQITVSGGSDIDMVHKLKNQLERISTEYRECSKYMDKVVSSMTHFDDVENFLNTVYDREKQYKKDLMKQEKTKDKKKGKSKDAKGKDSYESLVELFKKGDKGKKENLSKVSSNMKNISSTSSNFVRLPNLTKSDEITVSDNLLAKLKTLVANYEIVRLRMLTTEDRFRRDASRRDRKCEILIRSRDDEIFRLKTLLRESEAEADKYRRLYDNTKVGAMKKK